MTIKDEPVSFGGRTKNIFIRGIAYIIPLGLTFWFFRSLLNWVDGILAPLLEEWIGRPVPGLGFVAMTILIFIVGLLSLSFVGRFLFSLLENLVASIPIVRSVYGAIRDLVSAFSMGDKGRSFREVVLFEYPRRGLYSIGFVSNEMSFEGPDGKSVRVVNVYVPNPPNPTSGVLILVPREEALTLDMPIEKGLKLVLSGGIVVPERVLAKHHAG